MKINWGKVAAFLAGGCVGAAISAFVTDKVVSKAYSRAADDEIHEINSVANERIKKARKEVTELKQKVAQQKVTINTLADQVRESGKDVSDILKDDDDSEDDPGQVNERKPVERREEAEKVRTDHTLGGIVEQKTETMKKTLSLLRKKLKMKRRQSVTTVQE